MERWTNRVALVTGAGGGIGGAICKALILKGLRVVGCDLDKNEMLKNVSGESERFLPIQCNLRDEKDILAMFEQIKDRLGGVDICINCAGLSHRCSILKGSTEDFRDMWEVNVLAYCICTRESVAQMKAKGVDDGHVIFINSTAGHSVRCEKGREDFNFYNATKFAVTAIIQGVRSELFNEQSHIRVTSVSPGIVENKFTHRMYAGSGQESKWDEVYASTHCLQSNDVAEAVVYAISAPPHVQIHEVLLGTPETPL